MSKIISFALIAFLVVFIFRSVRDIIEDIKAKRAKKNEQKEKEKEGGIAESKEE